MLSFRIGYSKILKEKNLLAQLFKKQCSESIAGPVQLAPPCRP